MIDGNVDDFNAVIKFIPDDSSEFQIMDQQNSVFTVTDINNKEIDRKICFYDCKGVYFEVYTFI